METESVVEFLYTKQISWLLIVIRQESEVMRNNKDWEVTKVRKGKGKVFFP